MTAFELLRQKLAEQRKIYRDSISDGSVHDYPQYQNLVGVLNGIHIAMRELAEIERLIEKGEDYSP